MFEPHQLRRFYLEDLLLHEVGHHVDWRYWSAANKKGVEEFAEQYAVTWARKLRSRSLVDQTR